MKKLLFLSSLGFLIGGLLLIGCKVKKQPATHEQEVVVEESDEQVIEKTTDRVIHAPGVINQKELDSIKAVKMKEKLKEKKD